MQEAARSDVIVRRFSAAAKSNLFAIYSHMKDSLSYDTYRVTVETRMAVAREKAMSSRWPPKPY